MSKVELNALINGMSGRIGNAVLRKHGSRTIVASRPSKRQSELSVKEKTLRDRFKKAINYAKVKMADPVAKVEYAKAAAHKMFMTSFAAAVRDYLKPPTIDLIKTDTYTGKINDSIIIRASDDFKVAAVTVAINLPSGALLESGAATFDANTLEWKYTATKANTTLAGTKIKVTAFDVPKNEASMEKVM